jgi:hypothetical protein
MTDKPAPSVDDLVPTSWDDVVSALAYALRFDERGRPSPGAAQIMASLAAEHLTKHLGTAGFVVLKKGATKAHSAG